MSKYHCPNCKITTELDSMVDEFDGEVIQKDEEAVKANKEAIKRYKKSLAEKKKQDEKVERERKVYAKEKSKRDKAYYKYKSGYRGWFSSPMWRMDWELQEYGKCLAYPAWFWKYCSYDSIIHYPTLQNEYYIQCPICNFNHYITKNE